MEISTKIQCVKRRAYYAKNRDRHRAYARKWYWANREKSLQMSKEYHTKNADAVKARRSACNKLNRVARNESRKRWRAENPEKVKVHVHRQVQRTKLWRQANPVKARIHNHRRRERVAATLDKEAVNVLSQLVSSAGRLKCGICGKNMPKSDRTIDHIIPLSKGGTGDVWNLRIVHHVCNIRKNAKMPDELNFVRNGTQPKKNQTEDEGQRQATLRNRHSNRRINEGEQFN